MWLLRPKIDASTCVDCGACDVVCPVLNVPGGDECTVAFWAKAKNDDLRQRSSSGGMFGLLAQDVLARDGVVIGAAWNNGCLDPRHVLIENPEKLDAVMRSKYVQGSISRSIYENVRDVLRAGRPVLFSGVACQVAAMRSYLGGLADTDNFVGVDVICHGVPSPELWRRWLVYVEAREDSEIARVNFRCKTTGWSSYSVMYKYMAAKDGATSASLIKFPKDWYMRSFLQNASLRSSCLTCPFKRRCGSDLTLGDFWGVKVNHPEAFDDKGVSAVIVNTDKGGAAMAAIGKSVVSGESSLSIIANGNPALVRSVEPYADRNSFMCALANGMPIPKMMRRWTFRPPIWRRAISLIKHSIKEIIKIIINNYNNRILKRN